MVTWQDSTEAVHSIFIMSIADRAPVHLQRTDRPIVIRRCWRLNKSKWFAVAEEITAAHHCCWYWGWNQNSEDVISVSAASTTIYSIFREFYFLGIRSKLSRLRQSTTVTISFINNFFFHLLLPTSSSSSSTPPSHNLYFLSSSTLYAFYIRFHKSISISVSSGACYTLPPLFRTSVDLSIPLDRPSTVQMEVRDFRQVFISSDY